MDAFDEWAKASTQKYPCFQQWADRLVELGASWDSFRRDRGEIVQDLVDGGIPLLAARDIVDIASAAVQRRNAPMAIFWDLENMPIPTTSTGRDVTSRLKSILAPHGDLVQFRGYASIGLGLIPQQKRSDLQLSGCHLVDCPHNGRKEVADKMIIVDAMQFAFLHPEGATLCFITGDVDYAYLLAVLQRPQWQTIVISKGTMLSMLHVNCDMKMRWETDILQLRYSAGPTSSGYTAVEDQVVPMATEGGTVSIDDNAKMMFRNPALIERQHRSSATNSQISSRFEPLTADEEWEDDVELLQAIVKKERLEINGFPAAARKSQVGIELRNTNPARFPNRDAIRSFFVRAIDTGAVVESGEGATKMLSLPMKGGGLAPLPLSVQAPISMEEIPERVVEMTLVMPFVLFAPWSRCPHGNTFPKGTFVQAYEEWAILMFHTLTMVHRTVTVLPWLRAGTLVDWRRVEDELDLAECSWSLLNRDEISAAVQRVVSMLEMMAENDDIYIAENILCKQLGLLYPDKCKSREVGALWVAEAVKADLAISFKRPGGKTKLVCLPSQYENAALAPFPPDNMDTTDEEKHVEDLIWKSDGRMSRKQVVESLQGSFETMQTPLARTKVFFNGHSNGRFFVAKGPSGQTVGLTKEQAHAALAIENEKAEESEESENVGGNIDATESDGEQDGSSTAGSVESEDDDDVDLEAFLVNKTPSVARTLSGSEATGNALVVGGTIAADRLSRSSTEKMHPTNAAVETPGYTSFRDVKGNPATRNLYVCGYGPKTTKAQLQTAFSKYAGVKEVFLMEEGYAFVNTTSREKAILARDSLQGTKLHEGVLKINFAKN